VLESRVSSAQQRLVRPKVELAAVLAQRGVTAEMLAAVLDQLQASRLIKPSTTDAGEAYELAHDYLLGEIKLDPEVQARKAAQELLEQELRAFNRYKTLLSPERLKVIEAYRADLQISPEAEQLLKDSQQAVQAQVMAEQERQQKDIEEARELARETEARRKAEAARAQEAEQSAARMRSRNRTLTVVTVGAFLALIAALYFGFHSNSEARRADSNAATAEVAATNSSSAAATSSAAEALALAEQAETRRQSRLALSRELAARAAQVLPHDTELATLLAAAALSTTYGADGDYTGEALAAMGQVLAEPPPLRRFGGHASEVNAAVFDRSGGRLATGDKAGVVQVWDVATGTRQFQLAQQSGPVDSVAFSPDGQNLLTVSHENVARLWSAADGKPVRALEGHTGVVVSAEYNPQGSHILTASQDGTARVWDSSGNFLFELAGHLRPLTVARYSPDGSRIVTADEGGGVRLWAADGTQLAELVGHSGRVNEVVFNRNGLFVTLADRGSPRLWMADGTPVGELRGQFGTSAAFHPFFPLLAIGNSDGTVWVWQFSSQIELVQQLDAYLGRVSSVQYSPDGNRLLTAGCDANGTSDLVDSSGNSLCVQSSAGLWDSAGRLLATLRQQRLTGRAVFSPAGDQILTSGCAPADEASGCTEGDAWLWGLDSFRLNANGPSLITRLEFSASGDQLLAVVGNQPQLYQAADGRAIGPVGPPQSEAGFSPDGKYLLTLTNERVQVWDAALQPVAERQQGDLPFDSAWFSPGGQWIVLELAGKVYELWPAPGQPPVAEPLSQYAQAIFSGDGRRLLTTGFDDAGQIWQVDDDRLAPLAKLENLSGPLLSASFSRDGSILLTLSEDGVAQLWDGASGRPLPGIDPAVPVSYAAVDATGTRIVVGSLVSNSAVLLDAHGALVRALDAPTFAGRDTFSPSGDLLLTWRCVTALHINGCLKLLDGQTGAEIAILDAPGQIMSSVQFGGDGRWLFTPYLSGAVGIWDRDGHNFATLPAGFTGTRLPQRVLVADNAAGTRLATGGQFAPLQVLRLYPDAAAMLAEANRRAPRAFTGLECKQYLHLEACP
jgi:WD40 repeat protein